MIKDALKSASDIFIYFFSDEARFMFETLEMFVLIFGIHLKDYLDMINTLEVFQLVIIPLVDLLGEPCCPCRRCGLANSYYINQ